MLFITYSFSAAAQGIITTVAGGGSGGSGGLATQAALFGPNDVVVDDTGNIYIAEDYFLWKVDVNGIIHLLGGDGNPGVGGDGIHVSQARFGGATSIAFDKNGDLFIADAGNHAIRKVDKNTGIITKVVGDWTLGYAGDGGPANSAKMKYPHAIAFDQLGNLYIADEQFAIRKVDGATGIITTIAGNGMQGTWTNGDTAIKSQLGRIRGMCLDQLGNIYFADLDNHKIGKINATTGVLSTIAGNGTLGNTGEGGLAVNAQIGAGTKVKIDVNGNLYFTDFSVVKKVDAISGLLTRVAGNGGYGFSGDGGSALQARLASSKSVCFDKTHNMYIADTYNYRVRKVSGVVGINDVEVANELVIFPVPTTGHLTVQSVNNIAQIKVRSLTGQLIYSSQPNNDQTQIDLSAQPSGVYIVSVSDKQSTISKKIILHH